jgi:hypothetical protein
MQAGAVAVQRAGAQIRLGALFPTSAEKSDNDDKALVQ